MNSKNIHENYHIKIKPQKRIINKNNFTYINTIFFVNKYFKNKHKILDVGCGVGTIDFFIASDNKKVLGIDISERAIKMANLNCKRFGLSKIVSFKNMDFTVSFPKEKFDGILVSEVLEHLDDDVKAVQIIKGLLMSKGIVIASSPSLNAPLYKLGLLNDFDKKVGHVRRYSENDFRKLFSNAGFNILYLRKTEGILRNYLYTNNYAGKLIRFIRGPISELVTFVDNLSLRLFGESGYYIIAQKR